MRITGLEPARLLTIEPKSIASANSAISAHEKDYNLVACFLSRDGIGNKLNLCRTNFPY